MDINKINQIFARLAKDNPHPFTELIYKNHFTLLVAIVLSAQATDVGVNKATKELFLSYDTPEKILILGEEGLKKYIKTIGLFNSKAKNIIKLCEILLDQYNGEIPVDFTKLNSLPGVGRKTANVFLNCAHGHPVIAVDTHVFRVSNRLGIINCKTVEQAEKKLNEVVPEQWKEHAHHWLILHGRYICKARNPHCSTCHLNQICEFPDKNLK